MKKQSTIPTKYMTVRKNWPALIAVVLTMCLSSLQSQAQTSYNFSTPASISGRTVELTIAGVVYQITGGWNISYANSSTGGYGNSASLGMSSASYEAFTLKRKDGKPFRLYGYWTTFTNGTYGNYGNPHEMKLKYYCTSLPGQAYTSSLSGTVDYYNAAGTVITEAELSYKYLLSGYLDNITVGSAGASTPPYFCNSSYDYKTVFTNMKTVGAIAATDPDGNALSYSLSGDDAGLFTINSSGLLSFRDPAVYGANNDANQNGEYLVTVTANDGNGGTATQNVIITIMDGDLLFDGCKDAYYPTAGLFRDNAKNVTDNSLLRYGYSTSSDFLTNNGYSIITKWNGTLHRWEIYSWDAVNGNDLMYTNTSTSAPFPPDETTGFWTGQTSSLGFGICENITRLFVTANSGSTLPVTLVSFNAKVQDGNTVAISWTTASETASSHFVVERSSDGNFFVPVGRVSSKGNSNVAQNYYYTDAKPLEGAGFYRLAQVDVSGKTTYSHTGQVKISRTDRDFTVLLNPSKNGRIEIKANKAIALSVYNNQGILLLKKTVPAGIQQLDVSRYAKGMYLLNSGAASERVIVE